MKEVPPHNIVLLLPPIFTVEAAELDGFGDVGRADELAFIEVCDGTRHAQDAVIAARAESHAVVSGAQKGLGGIIKHAVGMNPRRVKLSVTKDRSLGVLHPFLRKGAGGANASANGNTAVDMLTAK